MTTLDAILAAEAVSALDVSLQVELVNPTLQLRDQFDTSFVFASHTFSNARYLPKEAGGRIGVMSPGRFVNGSDRDEPSEDLQHPSTCALGWAVNERECRETTRLRRRTTSKTPNEPELPSVGRAVSDFRLYSTTLPPVNCIVVLCDTLRRDHCGPYHRGRPLSEVRSPDQPDWVVPTPNMDRLAARGTTFDNAYNGSTPCMPARRDLYTGRYDFLERGWGPLEPDDADLPRQVSGPPNQSIHRLTREGYRVSYLVTDHYHLWEPGSSNYHHGYTGHEFVRGQESDAWKTAPVEFETPDGPETKLERHFRNVALTREGERDHFAAQVFSAAVEWVDANHEHDDFYLHVDCFDPHEPWDPPEELLCEFDERGYDVEEWDSLPAYDEWRDHYDEDDLRHIQARYAAMVRLVDRWFGRLLDALDRHDLWEETMVVLTTDHGTFNADRGRTGKFHDGTATHSHGACSHIPLVVHHPEFGGGERRGQLVQLVDLYPTVLSAVGRPCPDDIHGRDLEPAIRDPDADLREYALSGAWGGSVSITDGDWILHQAPTEGNSPLYWYGITGERRDELGPYDAETGRREADYRPAPSTVRTWLSDLRTDPSERRNLADERPDMVTELRRALAETLRELDAPEEHLDRLGIRTP